MIAARRPAARLGRYELGEIIGVGGVAEAWRAYQDGASGFRKTVVVKRIRPELRAELELHAAFVREAQVAQRLQHANVVQVLDLGDDDGVPYLVLEHVDGCSLRVLLEHGPLPIELAVYIAEHVALALRHVHAATDERGMPLGLVHRDVTPGNVLLSRSGEVKLGDFGIVRIADGGSDTLPGFIKGTPLYLAPEQAAGRPIDGRADIFSLGLVLRHMLGDARSTDALDADVLAIVEAATEPSVRDRLPDADALLERLQRLRRARGLGDGSQALADAVRHATGTVQRGALALDAALASDSPHTQQVAGIAAPRRRRVRPIVVAGVLGLFAIAALAQLEPDPEPLVPRAAPLPSSPPEPPLARAPFEALPLPEPEPVEAEAKASSTPTRPVRPIAARGRLRVNVIPWADVRVDGKPLGRAPLDRALPVGRHVVELYNPDIPRRAEHEVVIAADRPSAITSW